MQEKLEQIARLMREINTDPNAFQTVTLAVDRGSGQAMVSAMLCVGARPFTHFSHSQPGNAIESAEIEINGVRFAAQFSREMTDEEKHRQQEQESGVVA